VQDRFFSFLVGCSGALVVVLAAWALPLWGPPSKQARDAGAVARFQAGATPLSPFSPLVPETNKRRSNPLFSALRFHPFERRFLSTADLEAIERFTGLDRRVILGSDFPALDPPAPGDWRSGPGKNEVHQTFKQYFRNHRNDPPHRNVLILVQVGPWRHARRKTQKLLARFLALYFERPVRWAAPLLKHYTSRWWESGPYQRRQYNANPILADLIRHIPWDAKTMMAVTERDIHPGDGWNFVFGLAVPTHRVGIFSLARLSPRFYDMECTPADEQRFRLRAMKTLAHEMGHLLGLDHCVSYACLMSGTNSLPEADAHPLHLCPLCMAKLAWSLGLDVRKRYADLAAFMQRHGFAPQAKWYRRQAARLGRLKTRP
jgi:archaemetzincin